MEEEKKTVKSCNILHILEKEYAKDPTLESIQKIVFMTNNEIKRIDLQNIYEMLTNTQLVILLISKNEKIDHTNVVTKFKKIVVKIPALKNVDDACILSSYHSLIEFGLLEKHFKGDWTGFCEYVKDKTTYMKQIIKKVQF